MARSEGVQDALWKEAGALAVDRAPAWPPSFSRFPELTDLQIKRVRAAVWNRIPPAILTTLYGITLSGLVRDGLWRWLLSESRTAIPSLMLILVFSAIIVLIVDLERPRQQLFQVSQEPMADVARRIQALRH